ncbi:uncharacterized protein LOC143325774 [Chaetodon auriga]|uniref:uncharacterized protein LOC143325774 n=1 Tax=Chaetodon auriga TaxID=39042 RepID=UPI004032A87F
MSQSGNPTDTQALLQSMLQKLKLQPGREGQASLHAPVPATAASTWGQGGQRGAPNLQKVNNSPVNGFEVYTNGIPLKEFGISAADSNRGLKGGVIKQPGFGSDVDRGLISFPNHRDNTDGGTGEKRVLGQATKPGITPTGTGQLFPAQSLTDADITSFERTDRESVGFHSSAATRHTLNDKNAATSMGQNQDYDRGFTPKVYMWSSKPSDANLNTGSQEDKAVHVGNGGFGALAQSKDMQIALTDQKSTNSSSRRKQRSSENKTRRWTQKIKERWRDRPGSFGKKGKEEEQKSEQGIEISPQNQLFTAETLINTSDKEERRSIYSLDSTDPSQTPLKGTEDGTNEGYMRSTGDFDFSLGSFSLLEEIVTGQEWAMFLNPNQSATSANQRPSEELKIPPKPHDSSQSPVISNHQGGVNNQWSFRGTEASPVSDLSMAQISPDAFRPVSMDVSEGEQQQHVHREADRSEPMEHGHIQSDGPGQQQLRPLSSAKPADILNNSLLKSRAHLNRKRQHQPAERRDKRLPTETMSDAKEADREGSIPSLSPTSSHVMEETGESHDSVIPLYTLKSPPPPLSPSSFIPFAHAPKSVLKHSISQDSESSVEIMTKRRRVEDNRRVHFSEEVVTIVPPELDLDATDSEEDTGAEEDSVVEQEGEVEQAVMEEVAPARRPALPAWILALKRRNTGRKHR